LFEHNPSLTGSPYHLRSSVSLPIFRQFVSALNDNPITLTSANLFSLLRLSEEFGFDGLLRLTDSRLISIEEQSQQNANAIATLQSEVTLLSDAVSALKSTFHSPDPILPPLPDPSLPRAIGRAVRPPKIAIPTLPSPPRRSKQRNLRRQPPAPFLDSLIILDFPAIFAEFREKRFNLLWLGSRDGFGSKEFHSRCDGHANTLTVIFDRRGNIFGGFTPVEWESRDCELWKADDSLKSFLFTLKNPHSVAERRFALKEGERHRAISCDSRWGPCFGYGNDIGIANHCNRNADSYTFFGYSYNNDTGLDRDKFFTGSEHFRVKEIEVFEITD
jgi:hypothetical protein